MDEFDILQVAISKNMDSMVKGNQELFFVDLGYSDELWELYLKSFDPKHNPVFRQRSYYDCTCCKQFVRNCGAAVTITDGEIRTVWDVSHDAIDPQFHNVVETLSSHVKDLVAQHGLTNIYRHFQADLGAKVTHSRAANGKIESYNHFYYKLPQKYFKVPQKRTTRETGESIASFQGKARSNYEVLKSSLEIFKIDAIKEVLGLIKENSLYRGEEHKRSVETFLALAKEWEKINQRNNIFDVRIACEEFLWNKSIELGEYSNLKNQVIGTLVIDLSNGVDIEDAVRKFESKVAPQNYKRPKALISAGMIKQAEETVLALGLEDALYRRHATITDITVDNVLFADRAAKQAMKGVFAQLTEEVADKAPDESKLSTINVTEFLKLLAETKQVDVWFDNEHQPNLMSLVAPTSAAENAKKLFKWNNNFSWSYNGEVADAIKERVKAAGGNVTGEMRCSLSWYNYDDLDLHCKIFGGRYNSEIYFRNKVDAITGGRLDVDMNAGSGNTRTPVENIVWQRLPSSDGKFEFIVNNFELREHSNVGFAAQIELGGQIHNLTYSKKVGHKENVKIATVERKNGVMTFIPHLESKTTSKKVWGVDTQKWHRVPLILNSPNYWDGQGSGNRHLFFILEKCLNPDSVRGFYNEHLIDDLNPHRRVFEVLGSKTKIEYSDKQLSGLGFSSTSQKSLIVKIAGKQPVIVDMKEKVNG